MSDALVGDASSLGDVAPGIPEEWWRLPKTREQARSLGQMYFFTGAPCKQGHVDRRFAKNDGKCVACTHLQQKRRRDGNPLGERKRKRHCKNENARKRRWEHDNPANVAIYARKRRDTRIKATPPWYDRIRANAVYHERRRLEKETGLPHNVDHIVALNGVTEDGYPVSGLHVHYNLQVLTQRANLEKSNIVSHALLASLYDTYTYTHEAE